MPTALTATAVEEPPSAPSAPAPETAANGQITVILQRPTVPGGLWTMKHGNIVRQFPDQRIMPKLRALLGNDRAATLLVHINADGSVQVYRRLN